MRTWGTIADGGTTAAPIDSAPSAAEADVQRTVGMRARATGPGTACILPSCGMRETWAWLTQENSPGWMYQLSAEQALSRQRQLVVA
jgi:hypothetical protein